MSEQDLSEIEARANAATPRVGKTTGDVEVDRHSLDDVRRLLAEVRRVRYALLHRCVVAAVDPNCEDCRVIIDVLEPATGHDPERQSG